MTKSLTKFINLLLAAVLLFMLPFTECVASNQKNIGKTVKEPEIVLAAPRDLAPGPKDAYYTSSILYVWESLVAMDGNGKPVPQLAKSWKMSQDAKQWIFKLRNNVFFHDGTKFNVDAVLANFKRYGKGPKASSFYSLDMNKTYPNFKEAVKINDYTVKLIFNKPVPTLVYNMTNFGSPMYSPKNFNAAGDFNGLPQGTGPFKLIAHKKDKYALLERNDSYYGEKAHAKKIRIEVIPAPNTRMSALKSEEIMGVMDLGAMPPILANELLKDNRFQISRSKSTITHYFTMNGKVFPFNDLRMKQAISLMIDRRQIVQALYGGYGKPTINFLNYSSPFYQKIKIAHNTAQAKQLAKQVLGEKRQRFDFLLASYMLDRYPYKAQAELIQSWLRELGLDADIKILDRAAFYAAQKKGEFGAALSMKGLPNTEPFTMFDMYMSSNGSSNLDYSMGYNSPKTDEILAKLKNETDMTRRVKYYHSLQEISAKEFPNIPLFNDENTVVFNKKIKGYHAQIYGVTLPQVQWNGK